MDISTLRTRWILPLLALLEHDLEYQRADLILDEDLRFPISHLARTGGLPVCTPCCQWAKDWTPGVMAVLVG